METEHLFAQAFLAAHPEEAAAQLERLTSPDSAALLADAPPHVAATVLHHMSPFGAVACRYAGLIAKDPRACGNTLRQSRPSTS